MPVQYGAYLSGLDILIAIAMMLPFIFLFAYSFSNGSESMHAYSAEMLNRLALNAKLQEVLALDWPDPSALGAMLENVTGMPYAIVKAPLEPSGTVPANVTRLTIINGDVYYIESGENESTDIN